MLPPSLPLACPWPCLGLFKQSRHCCLCFRHLEARRSGGEAPVELLRDVVDACLAFAYYWYEAALACGP